MKLRFYVFSHVSTSPRSSSYMYLTQITKIKIKSRGAFREYAISALQRYCVILSLSFIRCKTRVELRNSADRAIPERALGILAHRAFVSFERVNLHQTFIRAIGCFFDRIKDTLPFVSFIPFLPRTECSRYYITFQYSLSLSNFLVALQREMSVENNIHRIASRASPLVSYVSFFNRVNINRYRHCIVKVYCT